jgi:hypothetical protein
MIGAYGNSWVQTRGLDRLACESFVFDQAFITSPAVDQLYRGLWFGSRATGGGGQSVDGSSFPRLLRAAGLRTALVTDDGDVANLSAVADFAERLIVDAPGEDRTAPDGSDTQLARLFRSATEWLQTAREPFCLWAHARGMAGPWDAPWEFRNRFAEDEDPEPPSFAAMPDRMLGEACDPDELLGITHAYAGQIALLDQCIGDFSQALAQSNSAANTQLTFLAARGFPLGEHRRVGPCDLALYNELVQVPWFMRFPDGLGRLARSQALVQPADLPGTLLDWLALDRACLGSGNASSLLSIIDGRSESIRDRLLMVSRHDRAIRTPAWYLRQPEGGAPELYAKPSDRWEVNEVSNLMPDVVAGLLAGMSELEQAGEDTILRPLADALVIEMD